MTRILCLGDSITDCGRLFSADPLGKGYVKQLSCLLHNSDHRFSIENRGIDGFTLERLLQNTDFWIMMNTRRSSAQQQDLMNKFVTRYELLAKKLSCTNSRKRKLYFLEPFVFPWPRCYASWAPLLSQMSVHIKKISQDHGAVFLPLQNDLDQEAARSGPASITSDGIHLTPQGHQILADKLYKLIISER